jgi:hypothetical protein
MGSEAEKGIAQDLSAASPGRKDKRREDKRVETIRPFLIRYYRKKRIGEIEDEREIAMDDERRWLVAQPPSVPLPPRLFPPRQPRCPPPLHLLPRDLFRGTINPRPLG